MGVYLPHPPPIGGGDAPPEPPIRPILLPGGPGGLEKYFC